MISEKSLLPKNRPVLQLEKIFLNMKKEYKNRIYLRFSNEYLFGEIFLNIPPYSSVKVFHHLFYLIPLPSKYRKNAGRGKRYTAEHFYLS